MRFENPVLNRELIENLRDPRAFWLQALFVASLGAVVLIAWPSEVQILGQEERAAQIYDTFARGQLVLLALVAPVLSAPGIASERERKSLDLLLTSPLRPWHIVWGKLLSAVLYLMLLVVSSLPIFSCCLFLGGIGPREILATFLLLFTGAFLCGVVGLTAGAAMGRVRSALSVSYVIILPAILILVFANPMRDLAASIVLSSLGALLAAALIFWVQRRLRRPFDTAPKAADEERTDEQIGLVLDRRRFPDNLLSPRASGEPLDERVNPVYLRELHYELFGRGTLLVRLLLQVSLVAALPFFVAALAARGLWIYTFYMLVFVMLIAPSLTAGVFTQERERSTFDLLLTTGLDAERILNGKLLVNLRNVGLLVAFLFPFMALFWGLGLVSRDLTPLPQGVTWLHLTVGSVLVVVSTGVFVVLLTAFLSMICRTTLRSMVLTYLALGLLFIVPVVTYTVLTRLGNVPLDQAKWVGLVSPFYTVAMLEESNFLLLPAGTSSQQLFLYLSFAVCGSGLLFLALRKLFAPFCQFRHDRGL